jgi:pantothenate kinase
MTQTIEFGALVEIVRQRGATQRTITAIAGPPGAGKSTLAENLEAALNSSEPGSSAVMGMDGFHLDDGILVPRGWRPRKGAPHTFDFWGFKSMLERLKANERDEIAVPVFDRRIELARAAARMIPKTVRRLIVEGNYVLFDRAPWPELFPLYSTTIMATASRSVLRDRLVERWVGLGMVPQDITIKIEENDMINLDLIMNESAPAEFRVESF